MRASDDYFDDIVAFEGCTTWLYCDVRGFVTTGIGNLVASPDYCAKLPWGNRLTQLPAKPWEAESSWSRVNDSYDKTKSAAFYKQFTDLRLSKDFVRSLVDQRLERDFLPGIRRLCHDFDTWPLPARQAIVDMAYNLGVGGLARFHNLIAACQAQDWSTAAKECHRSTSREVRNAWTASKFLAAIG